MTCDNKRRHDRKVDDETRTFLFLLVLETHDFIDSFLHLKNWTTLSSSTNLGRGEWKRSFDVLEKRVNNPQN